jgi:hypothetical protein
MRYRFAASRIASPAQQEGMFRPLRELRTGDVTVRLAELIESTLSPNPLDRPNALTLASVLPVALEAADWKEFHNLGRKAYQNGDAETACEHLDKSARTAKAQEHHGASRICTASGKDNLQSASDRDCQ